MSWFKKTKVSFPGESNLTDSILCDEKSFYSQFTHDLKKAQFEVIIESPFITISRLRTLKPIIEPLVNKGVKMYIVTKHPTEHDIVMSEQAEAAIRYFEALGVQVLLCEGHHRKLALIDRKITWEGSLNILSQTHSREFMRRIESKKQTEELFKFLKFDQVDEFKS